MKNIGFRKNCPSMLHCHWKCLLFPDHSFHPTSLQRHLPAAACSQTQAFFSAHNTTVVSFKVWSCLSTICLLIWNETFISNCWSQEIHRWLIVVFEVVYVLFAIKETNKLNSNTATIINPILRSHMRPCLLNRAASFCHWANILRLTDTSTPLLMYLPCN